MARPTLPRSLGGLPFLDVVLAVALFVVAVGGLLSGQVHERPLLVTLPVAVIGTLLVAVRTRVPVTAVATVAVLGVVQSVLADESPHTLWSLVVLLVTTYTVAAEREEGPAAVGLALTLGGQFLCEWLDHGSDYPFDTLVFGGVWLIGRGTRTWRARATYAEEHQRDLARLAVAEERTRIARELHDVVAHGLSVIAVQADAAEAALGKDPLRAAEPLRAIRTSARGALGDMRQLLHVLRTDEDTDEPDGRRPARGLADLPALVAGLSEAGLPLTVDLQPLPDLPGGLELAVYRIVQEGLTNVMKHAGPVPTRLVVDRDPACAQVRVSVSNAAPLRAAARAAHEPPGGHGLIGIRERVLAMGGSLSSGPTGDGGFELVAMLPLVGALA